MSAANAHDYSEALDRITRSVERYAQRSDYHLFPDETVVRTVVQGLADNLAQYGLAYCPCREVTGEPQRDRRNICPCTSHHDDIARDGYCDCGLYVSGEFLASRQSDKSTEEGK